MSDVTDRYNAWRVQFQSDKSAAQSAFLDCERLRRCLRDAHAEIARLSQEIDRCKTK